MQAMSEYEIKALDLRRGMRIAAVDKHKGCGFGGCWCTWFHSREGRPEGEKGRPWKERLVREGNAHAAMVFDGGPLLRRLDLQQPDGRRLVLLRERYDARLLRSGAGRHPVWSMQPLCFDSA